MFGKIIRHIYGSRRKVPFLLLFVVFIGNCCIAQRDSVSQPKYSIEYQVFTTTGIISRANKYSEIKYGVKRTLLVYKQQLFSKINLCLAGDTYVSNKNKQLDRTPYLKRAYLKYRNENFSVSAGLLVLEQFKYQRKIWQLRYIDKTFQNKFKYGDNRSIGILLNHKLNRYISYDIAFTTGYVTPLKNASKKYQFMSGQTFSTNFCTFRLFNNISFTSEYEHVLSLFVSKNTRHSNWGIEGARKYCKSNLINEDKYGFSFFCNYAFSQKIMGFTRYDMNNELNNRYVTKIMWGGFEYICNKFLKTSFYYRRSDLEENYWGLALILRCT